MQCPECPHGTFYATIYSSPHSVRVTLTEQSCGCTIGVTGRLRLAAAALGQASVEQGRTLDSPVAYDVGVSPV